MDASKYPVTQGYGYDPSYPLNGGNHLGIDYGAPVGTPVVVNGVTIGLTGNTGASTGPHLHVGRWVNGQAINPAGGFKFNSATVTEVGQDAVNGKFVRVQGDGASWVYLHLSDNSKVKVGQTLQGDDMPTSQDKPDLLTIQLAYNIGLNRQPSDSELKGWTNSSTEQLMRTILGSDEHKSIQKRSDGYEGYAEDWARLRYIAGGRDPSSITQAERRGRLDMTVQEAGKDLDRDLPYVASPYELMKDAKLLAPGKYIVGA